MTLCAAGELSAPCVRGTDRREISLLLVGPQPAGTRVLVHVDSAVRVLDADEAALIDNALDGLAAAMDGNAFEHFFQDLIDREPELPAHLRA